MDLGNLGGLFPPADDVGFNEALAVALAYGSSVAASGGALVVNVPDFISYTSLAELDFVITGSGSGIPGCVTFFGTPDGFKARINAASSTSLDMVLNATGGLTITNNTGSSFPITVLIIRRNRKLKNYGVLSSGSGAQTPTPFTIGNVNRTALTPLGPTTTAWASGSCFVSAYLANTGLYHISGVQSMRIESPDVYRAAAVGTATAALMEFE